MSVSTEHTKDILQGDGERKSFPFSFEVLDKKQVKCIKVFSTGEEAEILQEEFDVSISALEKTVIYPLNDEPLADNEKLVIYRITDIKQDYSPVNKEDFDANAIKKEIDRLTMIAQELGEEVSRAVKVLISSDISPDNLLLEMNRILSEARKFNEETQEIATENLTLARGYADKAGDDASRALSEADRSEVEANRAEAEADRAKGYADSINPAQFAEKRQFQVVATLPEVLEPDVFYFVHEVL